MHGFLGTHESVPKRHFDRVQQFLQASLYSQETGQTKTHREHATLRRRPHSMLRTWCGTKKNPARMMWNNGGQRLPITLTTVVALTISRGLHCPRPICINHRVGQCGIECRYLIRYFRLHKNGSIYHQVCLLVQIIYSFSLVENFIQFNFQ